MKKRPGIVLVHFILILIVIVILCSYALPSNPQNIINSFNDNIKKDHILTLDTGLSSWFRTHGGKYPDDLSFLKAIEIIPNSMDLSDYSYTVDTSKIKYRLTTVFSDGTVYSSPMSNYQ